MSQPDLTPLPTTGLTAPNTVVVTKPKPNALESIGEYIIVTRSNIPVDVVISDEELVELGAKWCEYMQNGMNKSDLVKMIEGTASTKNEAYTWLASAEASATYMCSDQEYRWNP